MSVVTTYEDWPPAGHRLTVADLDRFPDDGRRYELLDGVLVVSPRPTTVHQLVVAELVILLASVRPPGIRMLTEPALEISEITEFNPDLVVVQLAQIGGAKIYTPPSLVVEVRSPSTAVIDLNRKKAVYERFGVESYWIVVPDRDKPELVVFELRDGRYEEIAHVVSDEPYRATRPFAVEVVPSALVAGVPPG